MIMSMIWKPLISIIKLDLPQYSFATYKTMFSLKEENDGTNVDVIIYIHILGMEYIITLVLRRLKIL